MFSQQNTVEQEKFVNFSDFKVEDLLSFKIISIHEICKNFLHVNISCFTVVH